MPEPSEHSTNKIIAADKIESLLSPEQRTGKTIVFTNGCFDILHKGHYHLLSSAKAMGDILIIGLNSDESVRRLKGPSRPVNASESRAQSLAILESVDYIITFPEDTPLNLISLIKPDLLIKGGDYEVRDIVGFEFVSSYGGKVATIPFLEGFSTTKLIDKSKQK